MKSGRKIHARKQDAADLSAKIRKLSNGNLRSLLRAIQAGDIYLTETGGQIAGLCMVHATERWMNKGNGKNL